MRSYIVRLVVAVTLPLLAFEAFLLIRSARNEQLAIATTADERAQGAAADLDRELHNLQDLLAVFAGSAFVSMVDRTVHQNAATQLFRDRALGISVRNSSGQQVINTCDADGHAMPLDNLFATRNESKARISNLTTEPGTGTKVLTMDLVTLQGDFPHSFSLFAFCPGFIRS